MVRSLMPVTVITSVFFKQLISGTNNILYSASFNYTGNTGLKMQILLPLLPVIPGSTGTLNFRNQRRPTP